VPLPIQSASLTERLRKFFRIRGKTAFSLDEIVAPVVIVQDLTKGPYQAGVTPAAGTITWTIPGGSTEPSINVLLNDKPGSIVPQLGNQFDGRSFSFTYIEIQQSTDTGAEQLDILLRLGTRANSVLGTPITATANLFSIQQNDGSLTVPVEMFSMSGLAASGSNIWRGFLGDNINTLGTLRSIEPNPELTIGPNDALILLNLASPTVTQQVRVSFRGFYQEQPA